MPAFAGMTFLKTQLRRGQNRILAAPKPLFQTASPLPRRRAAGWATRRNPL
ncbi:hypothetical protein HMPREF9123_2104 [Neisseria bacilliformis ATCC BAA-1200]|uniref:Uncharacterized protein n=1 Tax=Neisseria bacilliformis ATCC BAA-1200 TaxID=888742 RepID=F2BEE8_9NEIS|nr:hypothetical protein HMPREF9123_2104 [Neisseria bacilliformis ATCC BAA-1200]